MEISNKNSSEFFFGDVVADVLVGEVVVGDVVVGNAVVGDGVVEDAVIGDVVVDFEVDMDDGDKECDDNFAVESLRIVV